MPANAHLFYLFGDLTAPDGSLVRENFASWFADSKVKNADGKPMVVYHGTRCDFTVFESGRKSINTTSFGQIETSRSGIFFSPDKDFAGTFAKQDGANGRILETFLSIQDPFDMRAGVGFRLREAMKESGINVYNLPEHASSNTWKAFDHENGIKLVAFLRERGYDGAIITEENEEGDSVDVYVAFDPEQIKSAIDNSGAYSMNDPDISDCQAIEMAKALRAKALIDSSSSPTMRSTIP